MSDAETKTKAAETITDRAKLFIRLTRAKREAERTLNVIKAELEIVIEPLIQQMIEEGVQNINLDDMTIYKSCRVKAGPAEGVTRADFVQAIEAAGIGDACVTYQWQALCKQIGEWKDAGIPIPEPLASKVKVFDAWSLGARNSA